MTLNTCDESDAETWPNQQKDNNKDKDNDNDNDNENENDNDNDNDDDNDDDDDDDDEGRATASTAFPPFAFSVPFFVHILHLSEWKSDDDGDYLTTYLPLLLSH